MPIIRVSTVKDEFINEKTIVTGNELEQLYLIAIFDPFVSIKSLLPFIYTSVERFNIPIGY